MADAPAAPASPARARAGSLPLEALRTTLGRPPVWLVIWAVQLLLALAPALVHQHWFQGATAHRYPRGRLFANLDAEFRFDQRQESALVDAATGQLGAVIVLLAMLAGGFFAGGWLQVFLERTGGHSLRRFFLGGSRYFWRFVRLLVLSVLTLALASWVIYGLPWNQLVLGWLHGVPASDWEKLETLASESTVVALRGTQHVLFALAFGLVMVWGDYTRTRIALHDTSSALWAGLCTWFTLLRHPVRTLGPGLSLFALEVALVLGAGWFSRAVEGDLFAHPDMLNVAILLAVGQLVLLWQVVLRGARYHAAVQVSREVVRPIARPDPWKSSVGGPGGPRYPIGGDEYGVSL